MRPHSTHSRDSSLRRLSVVNRWLIAASVTLTGVLTDVAAHAFPSKKSSGSTSKTGGSPAPKHSRAKAHAAKPSHKLQPPAEAPKAAPQAPPAAQQAAPKAAPAEEPPPAREAAPERQPAPEPAPEPAPAQEAPREEPSAPVVSGGS
ncbi:MAG TPA: hypothetical protein VGO29_00895 [Solirubrobacteraceae bacterium]|jgi:type IV secretory pathway VirB10-like protein|nr:hypothetical protein [Solirubrobacteraceae bacterium]